MMRKPTAKLFLGLAVAAGALLLTADRSLAGGGFSLKIGTTVSRCGHDGRTRVCSICKPVLHRGDRDQKGRHGSRDGWRGPRRPVLRPLGRDRDGLRQTRVVYLGPRTVIIRPPLFCPNRKVNVIKLSFSW